MSGKYQDLKVWQLAMDLVVRVYELTQAFPDRELYGLTSQMRRAAVSIPSNIAEGKGRTSNKELGHFLSNARGSICELETQIRISIRLKYLSAEAGNAVLETLTEVARMLTGLMTCAARA